MFSFFPAVGVVSAHFVPCEGKDGTYCDDSAYRAADNPPDGDSTGFGSWS